MNVIILKRKLISPKLILIQNLFLDSPSGNLCWYLFPVGRY